MRDVMLINKVRGLKMQPGDYIDFNPDTNSYIYLKEDKVEGEGYSKYVALSYEFSPEYIDKLVEKDIVEYSGEDKPNSAYKSLVCEGKDKEVAQKDSEYNPLYVSLDTMWNAQQEFIGMTNKYFNQLRENMFNIWI